MRTKNPHFDDDVIATFGNLGSCFSFQSIMDTYKVGKASKELSERAILQGFALMIPTLSAEQAAKVIIVIRQRTGLFTKEVHNAN